MSSSVKERIVVERVLVTGGTGKTGRLVAQQLAESGVQPRIASRRPAGANQIRFDWSEPETFEAALEGTQGVYLVAPTDRTDHLSAMLPFLELAIGRVPGRLVLLSASSLEMGGPLMGEVHAWLHDHASRWSALRPSWFMQNFVTERLPSILHDQEITSATGDGRVPFIDAWDIAAVAVAALTRPDIASREHVLTGPEAFSYDDVAAQISDVVGCPIRHRKLSLSELTQLYVGIGLPVDYAPMLAGMDEAIARGSENRVTNEVAQITGRPPRSLQSFLEAHRGIFRGE
jgi:uncharacterized protein YbjT (DUF2867 family)